MGPSPPLLFPVAMEPALLKPSDLEFGISGPVTGSPRISRPDLLRLKEMMHLSHCRELLQLWAKEPTGL